MNKRKFTQEEDSKICHFVKIYGTKRWSLIAKNLPNRTGKQIRDRYRNYLFPGFFNGQWSKEEGELLFEKFNLFGNKWSNKIPFFPNRSSNSIRNRVKYLKSSIHNDTEIINVSNIKFYHEMSKKVKSEPNEQIQKNEKIILKPKEKNFVQYINVNTQTSDSYLANKSNINKKC